MRRQLLGFFGATALFALVIYLSFADSTPHAQPAARIGSNSVSLVAKQEALEPIPPAGIAERPQRTDSGPIKNPDKKWNKFLGSSIPEYVQTFREDPDIAARLQGDLVSRAAIGSAAAALTLYQLALYCEQHSAGSAGVDASPASCSQVSNSLKQTSWRSLRSIAENGNTEVATYMLSQARAEARSSARSGSQATLATDALVALEGAAANRSLGAVRLLGMVYFDGIIVQPDIVKAYAFTRIYSEATGDPVMTGQTLKLFALLRQSDFNVAEKFIDDFEERLKR